MMEAGAGRLALPSPPLAGLRPASAPRNDAPGAGKPAHSECTSRHIDVKEKGGTADTSSVRIPRPARSSRIFIRLAAPLALTLLLPFAIGFEWPAALRWAILTTMTLSWLGFAWWTTRAQAHRSPEHARVLREQDQLLTDLRNFVGNEIDAWAAASMR
ncbi:hypothetical protein G6F40_016121 [Rhizopus arrhizus]|nr:hypothetical protein G6F40_016121 [Rhizopus arrhizus]